MRLGADQQAVVTAPSPGRVLGPALTGKTIALRARFQQATGGGATALCASPGAAAAFDPAATTFERLAAAIVARHARPVDVLSPAAAAEVVEALLAVEGKPEWPTLAAELDDPDFAAELTATVCRYQASFLGDEELFTHAEAAGELDRWEELARFTGRYLNALEARGAADWAGVLVQASLLLRRPEVASAERLQGPVVVDDWQRATFALHRLLSQLTGPSSDVVVAGDPSAHVSGRMGSSPRYLDDFPRRFSAGYDAELDELRAWPPAPEAVLADERSEGRALAAAVASSEASVVLARDDTEVERVRSLLLIEGGTCPVVAIEDAVSRHWPSVVVASCRRTAWPAPPPQWFDTELFGGPDMPPAPERAQRGRAEERRAWNVASTRATRRITLVVLEAPGRGFQLPDGLA